MIASARGDDATRALFGGEQRKDVRRTAQLERAGVLIALALEPHIAAEERAQSLAAHECGARDVRADAIVRRSMAIAADICIYTNRNLTIETL